MKRTKKNRKYSSLKSLIDLWNIFLMKFHENILSIPAKVEWSCIIPNDEVLLLFYLSLFLHDKANLNGVDRETKKLARGAK